MSAIEERFTVPVVVNDVDVLLVVDDSPSMAQHQALLRAQLPAMMRALVTGQALNPDGAVRMSFPPVTEAHIAVVSSSLGLPAGRGGCVGDPQQPRISEVEGCGAAGNPAFLGYRQGEEVAPVVDAVACLAQLGTSGCGVEQPLEAALLALGEAAAAAEVAGDSAARPATLLRGNRPVGTSLIGVVIVSDEDDCSAPGHGDPPPGSDPACGESSATLHPVQRYVDALRALRPGREQLVVFSVIAGVPPDLVVLTDEAGNPRVDFYDEVTRERWYDALLGDPRMVDRLDAGIPVPACETSSARAYPARRLVEVARGFGPVGMVQSICDGDFTGALRPFIEINAKQLGYGDCLPRPLAADADGLVDCEVRFELSTPEVANPGVPVTCKALSLPVPPQGEAAIGEGGGNLCVVPQLAVEPALRRGAHREGISDAERFAIVEAIRDRGAGFYYDDFSTEVASGCPESRPQRIAYTDGVQPPQGATVVVRCTLPHATAVEYPELDERFYASLGAQPPGLGTPCGSVPDGLLSRQAYYDGLLRGDEPDYATVTNCAAAGGCRAGVGDDVLCRVRLAGDRFDERMFCHPRSLRCVRRCDTDDDCPTDWLCDGEDATLAEGGDAFCVNPGCEG